MINYIKIIVALAVVSVITSCGNNASESSGSQQDGKQQVGKASDDLEDTSTINVHDYLTDGSKGVGPITAFERKPFDQSLADEGSRLFITKCSMCHRIDAKLLGPPLSGVTKKRTPEWILNMMLAPEKMIEQDKEAKKLFEEYQTPMTNLGLTEEEAISVLEYLRQEDAK